MGRWGVGGGGWDRQWAGGVGGIGRLMGVIGRVGGYSWGWDKWVCLSAHGQCKKCRACSMR